MSFLTGIRAVVFDAVGTVILPNPSAATVYAETTKRRGIAVDEAGLAGRLWRQFRIEDDLDRGLGWRTDEDRERTRWSNIVSAAIPGADDDVFEELFRHYSQPSAWKVIDGVAETLVELQTRGFVLALASNYDSRLASVLAGLSGLDPLRQRVVISSVVGYRKPAVEFFRDGVLPAVGCEAGRVLFVGDDLENDYHGARSVGMRAVLFDPADRHLGVENRIRSFGELLWATSQQV